MSKEEKLLIKAGVTLNYNTLSHSQKEIERVGTKEPKWNIAFWLHDSTMQETPRIADYGMSPDDVEMNLRDSWCASVNLKPDGHDETGRPTYDEPELYREIVLLCGRVVRKLHEDHVIMKLIGKSVPVIIERLDWSDEAFAASQASNPPELLGGYLEWIRQRRQPNY